ncbi:hypothetical protein V8F06_013237 [Rhypophila decipiens]
MHAAVGLVVYFCAALAQQVTFPSTVEVDLVFPRNDTYSPEPFFPLVFAIQNPGLIGPLLFAIPYVIWSSNFSDAISGVIYVGDNVSSSDTYFPYRFTSELRETEDTWYLKWEVASGNCSESTMLELGGSTNVSFPQYRGKTLGFTTKKGAKLPDLVAATDQDTCAANMESLTYNVTGTLATPHPFSYDGRNSCAVLSSTSPSPVPNPCGANFNASAASSIAAAITATLCAVPVPGVSCPPKNHAVGSLLGGLGWFSLTVGWVACLNLL